MKVAILGLGYVGSELLSTINKNNINVVGYDIDKSKVNALKQKYSVSYKKEILNKSSLFIVCVPTPINERHKPDLSFTKKVCKTISDYIQNKPIIVFESTFYPGVTEDICIKEIEKYSKKKINKDFYVGYSPERYSPGEKKPLSNIDKLVSASNKKTANFLKLFYSKFINKVHIVENIKIAELSKNFENCQRDLNIALFNELFVYCEKLNIDYTKVIKASKTKWNFHPFLPGLVGGHCISVDPYYLIFDSQNKKVSFKTLETSRKINNKFINYIYHRIKKFLIAENLVRKNILFYGLTYKPNTSDLRNSGAKIIYDKLRKDCKNIVSFDPYITEKSVISSKKFSIIIAMVSHSDFKRNKKFYRNILVKDGFIFNPFKN
tara:strand:+ start:572 stop:1705 length:1134 start_codon:yes stop_codon:yes gene_type:complete